MGDVTLDFRHSKNATLLCEFRPWLTATARVCDELLDYDTWAFDYGEQSVVGVFGTGAARSGILPFFETYYDPAHDRDRRKRADLWLATSPHTFLEFKIATWGKNSDNLNTRLGEAEAQLKLISAQENPRKIAVVIIAFEKSSYLQSPKLQAKLSDFSKCSGDVIACFQEPNGRCATAFFKEVK